MSDDNAVAIAIEELDLAALQQLIADGKPLEWEGRFIKTNALETLIDHSDIVEILADKQRRRVYQQMMKACVDGGAKVTDKVIAGAAENLSLKEFQWLYGHNSNPNATDPFGYSALKNAVRREDAWECGIAKYLLEAGADVNAQRTVKDTWTECLLPSLKDIRLAQVAIEKGANEQSLTELYISVRIQKKQGWLPEEEYAEWEKLLLKHGATLPKDEPTFFERLLQMIGLGSKPEH